MQLSWPNEMKQKHVSIGRPATNLQRQLEMQFSQDLNLKLFRRFVSGHDLCPPPPPVGDVTLWWPAPPYTCYICAVARVHVAAVSMPLGPPAAHRRKREERDSLSPRTDEILIL